MRDTFNVAEARCRSTACADYYRFALVNRCRAEGSREREAGLNGLALRRRLTVYTGWHVERLRRQSNVMTRQVGPGLAKPEYA